MMLPSLAFYTIVCICVYCQERKKIYCIIYETSENCEMIGKVSEQVREGVIERGDEKNE